MTASLLDYLSHPTYLLANPFVLLTTAFVIWMLVDAIRRQEWLWAILIFFFHFLTAVLYFFFVYRQAGPLTTQGFELPGSQDRKRIKELENQIHHLDKAHHYYELGDIYFQQSKFDKAEECYRAALERDSEDIDIRAHLGQCLLRQQKPAEAKPLLEQVCTEKADHDYGYSMMALAECLTALGEKEAAQKIWKRVLDAHSYSRARVQLAQLYLEQGKKEEAKRELNEAIRDYEHAPAFHRKHEKVWAKRARSLLRKT